MNKKRFTSIVISFALLTAISLSACSNKTPDINTKTEKKVFVGKLEKEPKVISEQGSINEIVKENTSENDFVVDVTSKGIIFAESDENSFEAIDKNSGKAVIKTSGGYVVKSPEDVFVFEDGTALWIEAKLESTGFPDDKTWTVKYRDIDGKVSTIDQSKGYEIESNTFNITYPLSLRANQNHICYSTFEKTDGKIHRVIKLYDIKTKKFEIIDLVEDYKNRWFSIDMSDEYISYSLSESRDNSKEFGKIYLYSLKNKSKEELVTDYNLLHPQIGKQYLVAAIKPEGENFIADRKGEYITKEFWIYDLNKKEWSFRVNSESSIFEKLKAEGFGVNLENFRVKDNYLVIDYLGKTRSFIVVDMDSKKSYNPGELLSINSENKEIQLNAVKFAESKSPVLIWSDSGSNKSQIMRLK